MFSYFETEYGYGVNADCFDAMTMLANQSIDMILCDLPYGSTACKWDSVLPLDKLWLEYKRLCKGTIVLTASQPFTTTLIASNLLNFKYCWVWNKQFSGNFVQAKRMPLKVHEDIAIFSFGSNKYKPLMEQREKPIKVGRIGSNGDAIPNMSSNEAMDKLKGKLYTEKFPTTILHFSSREQRGLHPTQKPVSLFEYLIKTYTNEGDTVLDNTAGSMTTGVACENLKRRWLCIEKDIEYYEKAKARFVIK